MGIRIAGAAVLAATLCAITAGSAQAQAWDAPSYLPPRPGDDIGVYVSNQADFGIQGIWRQTGNLNLGVRVGYVDTDLDGAVTVGAETWGLLVEAGGALPVDVTWTFGAGAGFNGGTTLEVPAGLSIGLPVDLDPFALQVYGHPRVGLFISSSGNDTSADLGALFDLGVEAALSQDLKLRLNATFGEADALGIGLAYRWSRGAVVR